MQTTGISLYDNDNQEQENRKRNKTPFIIASVAVLGVAGALGLGVMFGGRGGDGATATGPGTSIGQAIASTAADGNDDAAASDDNGSNPNGGGLASDPASPSGNGALPPSDDEPSGDDAAPVEPTAPPEPVEPSPTPEPEDEIDDLAVEPTPTNTPEPLDELGVEPTPTPIDVHICIPCLEPEFDPEVLWDFTAPEFEDASYTNCLLGTWADFEVDEVAYLWVTYTFVGFEMETDKVYGTEFHDQLTAGVNAGNIVFHAEDASGNYASIVPAAGGLCAM